MFYALVILLLIIYFTRKWIFKQKLPPGPWGLPMLGYLPWLDQKAPYKTLTDLSKKYGPMYSLQMGSVYAIVLTDVKLVRKMLAKDVTTGRAPLYLTHGLMKGCGIICSEGDLWKDQRKFVTSCLRQFGCLKVGPHKQEMENLILSHVDHFVKSVKLLGDKESIDPAKLLKHNIGCAVNIFVFGVSFDENNDNWKFILQKQEEGPKLLGVAGAINFVPWLRFLPKYQEIIHFLSSGIVRTHEIYADIIKEQNLKLSKKLESNPSYEPSSIVEAFLMEREKRRGQDDFKFYHDQQFHYLLADLFGASLDTTMTTIMWFFLYIAIHEESQTKMREELKEVLQDRKVSASDAAFTPYTEACIAEVQRIRSVTPVGIPHGAVDTLEFEGYTIPAGTMIVPLQWAIHMDEKIWPEPDNYNPNRFIDEEGKFFKPEAFIPFQTGKRMCVGEELAKILLYLFCATTVQQFEITLSEPSVPDLTGICGLTLVPNLYKLRFKSIL